MPEPSIPDQNPYATPNTSDSITVASRAWSSITLWRVYIVLHLLCLAATVLIVQHELGRLPGLPSLVLHLARVLSLVGFCLLFVDPILILHTFVKSILEEDRRYFYLMLIIVTLWIIHFFAMLPLIQNSVHVRPALSFVGVSILLLSLAKL